MFIAPSNTLYGMVKKDPIMSQCMWDDNYIQESCFSVIHINNIMVHN